MLSVIATIVWTFARSRFAGRELERRRAALLGTLRREDGTLDERMRGAVERDEIVLRHFAGTYPGDLTAVDLHASNALARSIVYVHGPIEAFAFGAPIDKAAAASFDDTFVRCLLDPPKSRSERDVLAKVRDAYGTNAGAQGVHRLADAYTALRVLAPGFEEHVRAADEREILAMERQLERAHLDDAKKALDAPLLLAVMDEPGDGRVPADLDGERPHDVRVLLYDTVKSQPIVRARKRVDPSRWSASARVDFSSGLDACALAYDLRRVDEPN